MIAVQYVFGKTSKMIYQRGIHISWRNNNKKKKKEKYSTGGERNDRIRNVFGIANETCVDCRNNKKKNTLMSIRIF